MEFRTGMITLILVAGIFTITPYGMFGGNIMPAPGPPAVVNRETIAGLRGGSYTGAAAGGPAEVGRAPECRQCMSRATTRQVRQTGPEGSRFSR